MKLITLLLTALGLLLVGCELVPYDDSTVPIRDTVDIDPIIGNGSVIGNMTDNVTEEGNDSLDSNDTMIDDVMNGIYAVIAEDLDTPWEIAFLPDSRIMITQRNGNVMILDDEITQIAQIDVNEISEGGLLGLAIDPDFNENSYIYLYYTYGPDSSPSNRVSRFILQDDTLIDETILLDSIPSARYHNGGRIGFGPDGFLYITTGDATQPSSAQDIDSLAGKILRMENDGSIPEGNPFSNYVYSYGHRNPQGITWDDEGTMYSSEHGPNRHDEINLITQGGNYGWPDTCDEQAEDTIAPLRCYTEFTLAPGDIEYLDGNLYVTGLRGTQLRKLELQDGEIISESILIDDLGRLRALETDGNHLYASTSNKDGRGIPDFSDDKIILVNP